ncbi:MAG: GntR family transcriptional regulator [Ruminococcus sp.]|jgi:DNA-binding GntR family transcriptional regulator
MAKRKSSIEVYRILKDEIQYLKLEPGYHIHEPELIEKFGVSRTPIREALLRLETDGLVTIYPQNGTYVAKINFKLATEVAYMRHLLDTDICLQLCREKTPVRDAVDEAVYFMSSAVRKNDIVEFVRQDDHFHESLFQVAGHEQIWKIIENSHAHNNRVRMLDMQRPGTMEPSLEEHRKIVECIEQGKEEELQVIMDRHHDHKETAERETLFRQLYPDFFE